MVQILVAGCRKVVGTTHSGSSTSREVVGTTQWEYSEFLSPNMPVIHRIKTFFKRKFIITFLICLSSLNPNLLRLLDLLRKAHLPLSKRDNILVILGSVLNKFTTAVPTTSATSWTAAYTGFGQKMSNVTSIVYFLS